ncbi:MAG: acyl-CoA thioesterase [Euryarchaeota archaeon]|nr:acyl-CoA thioesterase [Euryarchaeota archaeon]
MRETAHRVRYFETDQLGVANCIHFFRWFEIGGAEMLRALGIPVKLMESKGCYFVIRQTGCTYEKSLKYDDLITIGAKVAKIGKSSVRLEYEIRRKEGGEVVATGHAVHVATDGKGKSVPIPEWVRKALEKAEK